MVRSDISNLVINKVEPTINPQLSQNHINKGDNLLYLTLSDYTREDVYIDFKSNRIKYIEMHNI